MVCYCGLIGVDELDLLASPHHREIARSLVSGTRIAELTWLPEDCAGTVLRGPRGLRGLRVRQPGHERRQDAVMAGEPLVLTRPSQLNAARLGRRRFGAGTTRRESRRLPSRVPGEPETRGALDLDGQGPGTTVDGCVERLPDRSSQPCSGRAVAWHAQAEPSAHKCQRQANLDPLSAPTLGVATLAGIRPCRHGVSFHVPSTLVSVDRSREEHLARGPSGSRVTRPRSRRLPPCPASPRPATTHTYRRFSSDSGRPKKLAKRLLSDA